MLSTLLVTGCGWEQSKKPSFLIIAVEMLNSETYLCGDPEPDLDEGFGALCEDGVRFTHTYTPSTMTQATLASVLTGLYPSEHGVMHNGSNFLSEKFATVAEIAIEKGYRTSFFSGGPPIWRKSGLDQGFELFEDNINISLHEIFRPVQKSFETFLDWLSEDAPRPYFSLIYVPDLQFPNYVTQNNAGQDRAIGFDGQLKEVSESISSLFKSIKSLGYWNSTNIILIGLNGRSPLNRDDEILPLNLFSDNSQVLMMIKPARQDREDGRSWSIDVNVSLVDLGVTLYDLLGARNKIMTIGQEPEVTSLAKVLQKPQVNWNRDRYFVTSASWAKWRGVGGSRSSSRKSGYLFINDQKPKLFNTLTDRFELQPLSRKDQNVQVLTGSFTRFLQNRGMSVWEGIPDTLYEKIKLGEVVQRKRRNLPTSISNSNFKIRLAHLIKKRPWDRQILGWLADVAINERDWSFLLDLGERHMYPSWIYVAKKNLGQEAELPPSQCWKQLEIKQQMNDRRGLCEDPVLLAFIDWVKEVESKAKTQFEEKFMREYRLKEIDEEIASMNLLNGYTWDTAVDMPAEPTDIHLVLLLPEFQRYRSILERRWARF